LETAANILVIVGGITFFSSIFFRAPDAPPFASCNPKHWKPVWRHEVRAAFRPPGYTVMLVGLILGILGMLAGLILRYNVN
jgi:hypothetical protein